MGESPIGWQDIAAWEHLTGIELDVWEARTIRRLSLAFLSQRQKAEKPDCPEPMLDEAEVAQAQGDKIDEQFKAMLVAFGKDK